jgi:hypothetical protein
MIRFSRDQLSTAAQIVLILFLLVYSAVKGHPDTKEKVNSNSSVQIHSASALRTQMVSLWTQHVAWNRNVMVCVVDALPGTERALEQLHQNKVEMGNAIKPFYGVATAKRFTALMDMHISLSVEVICLVKAGRNKELHEANQRWYRNADEIVTFLSETNPYWGRADNKQMIKELLTMSTNQAVHWIQHNFEADLVAYEKTDLDVGKMAAVFSEGIAWQFPEKFNAGSQVLTVKNELY